MVIHPSACSKIAFVRSTIALKYFLYLTNWDQIIPRIHCFCPSASLPMCLLYLYVFCPDACSTIQFFFLVQRQFLDMESETSLWNERENEVRWWVGYQLVANISSVNRSVCNSWYFTYIVCLLCLFYLLLPSRKKPHCRNLGIVLLFHTCNWKFKNKFTVFDESLSGICKLPLTMNWNELKWNSGSCWGSCTVQLLCREPLVMVSVLMFGTTLLNIFSPFTSIWTFFLTQCHIWH